MLEQLSTSQPVRTNVSIVETCVADWSVFQTYKNFMDTAKTLKIVYDSTVKSVKYFMDSIYGGIHVRADSTISVARSVGFSRLSKVSLDDVLVVSKDPVRSISCVEKTITR